MRSTGGACGARRDSPDAWQCGRTCLGSVWGVEGVRMQRVLSHHGSRWQPATWVIPAGQVAVLARSFGVPPAGFEPALTAPEAGVMVWRICALDLATSDVDPPLRQDRSVHIPDHGDRRLAGPVVYKFAASPSMDAEPLMARYKTVRQGPPVSGLLAAPLAAPSSGSGGIRGTGLTQTRE